MSLGKMTFVSLVCAASVASAAPVGVDGTIGAEWGAATATVSFNAAAAQSNFGAPGTENHIVGYSVYTRSDANYLYVAVAANGATGGNDFANLYFDTDAIAGSNFGIEVNNDRFFVPSAVPGPYTNDTLGLATYAVTAGVVELALDWSLLMTDPYGMGFPAVAPGGKVILRLSQSFGYSVAGGPTYGVDRLGAVFAPLAQSVPEPGSFALAGLALAGLGLSRRVRRA
jgi:hypothetical protein